jgi:Domain of unknown function DUF29
VAQVQEVVKKVRSASDIKARQGRVQQEDDMATDEASHQDPPGRFHLKADYDTDFYAWTQTQADALRAKNWAILDLEHLAEEIESLGKSDRHAIVSHLECLLLHLLKWGHDPAREPHHGWQLTIRHARREIAHLLADNRSLHSYPAERLADAYRHARGNAAIDTGLPLATFAEVCP